MVQTNLDSIIRELMNEQNSSSPHGYARLVRIAKSGLKNELNLDIASITKVVELDIDRNLMTAPLPNDYITYKRIGMCINGRVIPLGFNPNLCIDRTFDDCGNVEPPCASDNTSFDNATSNAAVADGRWFYPSALKWRNGENLGGYFGIGGGNNSLGYYRIVEQYGEIHFGSLHTGTVVMEYLADVEKVGNDYLIHPYAVEMLKSWMAWASIRNKDGHPASDVLLKRKEYYNQRRLAAQRYSSFTLDEAYQYSRISTKQSPKV